MDKDYLKCALVGLAVLVFLGMGCHSETEETETSNVESGKVWLDSLDVRWFEQSYHAARAGLSVDGNPIRIASREYQRGVGVHAESRAVIELFGDAESFSAQVGVDDETCELGSVIFEIWVDGEKQAQSRLMKSGEPAESIQADLRGAQQMELAALIGDGRATCDHGDWANAYFTLIADAKRKPVIQSPIPYEEPIAMARGSNTQVRINGPRIVGASPKKPFQFLIPATGTGPLRFTAKNLPVGLTLDEKTGVISGVIERAGRTDVTLIVQGANGKDERVLRIECGVDRLALTPPMGWNSWNVYGLDVSDERIRRTADLMVETGLAAHGYCYINIDDGWQKGRDENGYIVPNEKFPDMKALADYVHSKGLKLGIYSSPGPKTCGGYEGSYGYEAKDVERYVQWGVDYLKYDWCSYYEVTEDQSLAGYQAPYVLMGKLLRECERDIVYSICQYGMADVWTWGRQVGGNLWRTTDDIVDTWESLSTIGFGQYDKADYAQPGGWNDPDMLIVGWVGWGGGAPYQTRLFPNEQITHITLWSLLSAPLLLGCDLSMLDSFTFDLLTNDEVIAVNQDPLGKQARRIEVEGETQVWAKELFDGTLAVGLFNRSSERRRIEVKWSSLGRQGKQNVRDLWQQKDLGEFEKGFAAEVPIHGVILIRIGEPK